MFLFEPNDTVFSLTRRELSESEPAAPQDHPPVAGHWADCHARMAALIDAGHPDMPRRGEARRVELTAYGEALKTALDAPDGCGIERDMSAQPEALRAGWASALVLAGHLEPGGDRRDWHDRPAVRACRMTPGLRPQVLRVLSFVLGPAQVLAWQDHPYRIPVCARLMLEALGVIPVTGESPQETDAREADLRPVRDELDAARVPRSAEAERRIRESLENAPPAPWTRQDWGVSLRGASGTRSLHGPLVRTITTGIANGAASDCVLAALTSPQDEDPVTPPSADPSAACRASPDSP
ncbi:hypothetical protein CDL60_05650 [Roseateles noduli]|nr:hypothetical protein CDL60_05650 [Roseateles noduli]